MALKVFKKFGLKRDLNLADIPSKKLALNNLLDALSDGITSFTWEDLAVIQNLYLSDLTNSNFTSAANATVLQTQPNGSLEIYDPLITLENRFDKAYFTTSEPYFFGGDGLSASYYDTDAILRETPGDPASNFLGFNQLLKTEENDFWERGYFNFTNKLSLKNISQYGAVQWEGYLKPSRDGVYNLRIRNRGFLRVEFDDKTQIRDFTYDPSTNTFNYINNNFTSNVVTGETGGLNTLIDQTKLTQSTNISTANVFETSSRLQDRRDQTISLGSLVQWEAYKIRLTYFIDEISIADNIEIAKDIEFILIEPASSSQTFNYKSLYTKNYFQNYDLGDFRTFVGNSISVGGTGVRNEDTIGSTIGTFSTQGVTPALGDSYANVNNFNPIVSYYSFPNSFENTEKVVSGCTTTTNSTTVVVQNALPNSTEFIELGNYVFGTGIIPGTRVTKVTVNSSIEISPSPTSSQFSIDLTFVNHRGLVAFGDGDTYDNKIDNITNSFGLSSINTDQIVLSSGLSFTYNDETKGTTGISAPGKLTKNYTGSIINLNGASSTNFIGNQRFYVYQTSGLIDEGLKFFCQGVFKQRLLATQSNTTSNSVTLDLNDVANINLNDYVHAFPSVNFGERADGSVDELYSKVRVTNIDTENKRITIQNTVDSGPALLSPLEYIPAKIKNIVFTPTDVNREVCFKPTDTAPPFAANSTGLTTSFGVSLVNDFTSNGGGTVNNNSTVAYNNLEIRHDSNISSNIIAYNQENISNYLPIKDDNGNTFYILVGN
jgi:hypothetical protein